MTLAAIQTRLEELSKHELVSKLARAEQKRAAFMKEHGAAIKRGFQVAVCSTIAATVGAGAGLLELKAPHIPKTKVRFDGMAGLGLSLANLLGMTGDALPYVQSAADALTGHATGRMAEKFAEAHGVTRTAA